MSNIDKNTPFERWEYFRKEKEVKFLILSFIFFQFPIKAQLSRNPIFQVSNNEKI